MRKKAFTLAELLVALGIVGVIAALTLPSLMNMKQEASAGPQLSKVKASVEDAASRILLEDPSKNLKEYTDFTGKMSEYLVMSTAEGGGYRLKDGVVIDFEEATGGNVSNASGSAFKKVNVDLNGTSKPNVAGVDKFEFLLSTQGLLVPQGCAAKLASNNWKVSKDYDSATCSSYTMGGTIADTIPDDEEYTPEGTKTCPDGTVIPSYLSCESNPDCTPIACGCGESWSALDCDCKPTPGFTKTCTGGKVWSETACSCVDNETPTPKSCTEDCGCGSCDTTTGNCIPADTYCPNGQHWDETICRCVADNSCQKQTCTGNTAWSEDDCKCVPITSPNPCDGMKGQAKLACECKENGGTWIANAPSYCSYGCEKKTCTGCSTWDEASCSCKDPNKSCLEGEEWSDATCSCVETSCSDPGTCGCGTWDSVNCECIPASKKCLGCGVWDEATCSCIPPDTTCSGCNKWDSTTCSCQPMNTSCPTGYEWSMGTCSCDAKKNNNDKVDGGPIGAFGVTPSIKNPDLPGTIGKDGSEGMLDAGYESRE